MEQKIFIAWILLKICRLYQLIDLMSWYMVLFGELLLSMYAKYSSLLFDS